MIKKKFLAIACSALIATSIIPTQKAKAWYGYTHYYFGQEIAKNWSEINRDTYASGELIADIGWMSWDGTYGIASDSNQFTDEIKRLAYNMSISPNYWIACGWYGHNQQDSAANYNNIINSKNYSERQRKAWVDEYVRDVLDADNPIMGTKPMYMSYDLIRNAYKNLTGFSPTNAQIDVQYLAMINAFNGAMLGVIGSYTSAEATAIQNELNRMIAGTTAQYDLYTFNTTQYYEMQSDNIDYNSIVSQPEDIKNKEVVKKAKKAIADISEEITNSGIAKLDVEKTEYDGIYKLTLNILDKDKYNEKLKKMNDVVHEENLTMSELLSY